METSGSVGMHAHRGENIQSHRNDGSYVNTTVLALGSNRGGSEANVMKLWAQKPVRHIGLMIL